MGETGVGKTSAGLNKLLMSLPEHYPRWGGLILDPKGVYWRTVQLMLETAERAEDLAVLRVRSPKEAAEHYQPVRFNLIGDPGTAENSGMSPSSMVGWVKMASRNTVYGSPASIATWTVAMISPASAPRAVKPRM